MTKVRLAQFVAGLVAASITRTWIDTRFQYRLDGFPSARVPSLRLHVLDRLGLASFYSQLGQDTWVLGVVFRGVTNGYFLEIGAADAREGSNTLALEHAGWSGVCVEPFPTGDWSARRAALYQEIAYSSGGTSVEFRKAGTRGGIDDHIELKDSRIVEAPVVQGTTSSLRDLLLRAEAPPFIHYLSVDTEGSEYEILRGFPFDCYAIGAMTIEHNGESEKRMLIRNLLEANGYRLEREHVVEDWYVIDRLHPRVMSNQIRRRRRA